MNLIIMSDTHGDINKIEKVLKRFNNLDMVIHLGDCVKDITTIRGEYRHLNFEVVNGNNDWNSKFEDEMLLNIENKKIFITHGHYYNVKNSESKIIERGNQLGADVVIYGHTHAPREIFAKNMLILNPGSLGKPIYPNKSSYIYMSVKDDEVISSFFNI